MLVEQLRRLKSTNCARNNGHNHWLMIVLDEGRLGYPRLGKRLNTLCHVYIDCMELLGNEHGQIFPSGGISERLRNYEREAHD